MTKTRQDSESPFARALRAVFDSSPTLDSYTKWADVLQVSPPAVSQWLSDTTLPRPDVLKLLLELITTRNLADPKAVAGLVAVLRMPSKDATPLTVPAGAPTLRHHMGRVHFDGFLNALRPLPPERQEDILRDAARQCRAKPTENAALSKGGAHFESLKVVFRILRERRWNSILVIGDANELKREDTKQFRRALVYLLEQMELYGKPQLTYLVFEKDVRERVENLQTLAREYVKEAIEPDDAPRKEIQENLCVLYTKKKDLTTVLSAFDQRGAPAQLIVAFNLDEPYELAYSWHKQGATQFGHILSAQQVALLRSILGGELDRVASVSPRKGEEPASIVIKPHSIDVHYELVN